MSARFSPKVGKFPFFGRQRAHNRYNRETGVPQKITRATVNSIVTLLSAPVA